MTNKSKQLDPLAAFGQLKPQQQLLVAAAMTERMLPNYLLFAEVAEFGEAKVVQDSLKLVWEKLCVKNLKVNIDIQLEKLEPNIPDVANFDMFGVYPALDTAMALLTLVGALHSVDSEALLDVCRLSQSSVVKVIEHSLLADDLDGQHLGGQYLGQQYLDEQQLNDHELMQYEQSFLQTLVDMASKVDKIDKTVVTTFRHQALVDGMTNIGLQIN